MPAEPSSTAGRRLDLVHSGLCGTEPAAGVEGFAGWLSTDANDGLPMVATLVGAILLARATAGTELSEKILESTHKALTAPHGA